MRRRTAFSRDTLQAHRLPPTEYMELNYRPALAPPTRVAASIGVELSIIAFLIVLVLVALPTVAPALGLGVLFSWTIPLLLVWSFWPTVFADTDLTDVGNRYRWAFCVVAALLLVALAQLNSLTALYFVVFGQSVACALLLALLIAKQAAYWMTVHPRVGWREVRQWRRIWAKLFTRELPADCPELLSVRAAVAVLLFQVWLGYEVLRWEFAGATQPSDFHVAGWQALAVVFLPLPLYWLAWHYSGVVPRISLVATVRATLLALHVWFAYSPGPEVRPGVFLLPTKWLRPGWVREALCAIVVAGFAISVFLLSHVSALPPPNLSGPQHAPGLQFDPFTSFSVPLFVEALVLAVVLPPFLFLLVMWFVIGSLLARYWLALEAPRGYAQAADRSAWAIAVDRILNSRDLCEREHLLLGRSLAGDYPVLLHRGLLHQHAHLVGDSGARKTSLGIAPTIAQLIAANNASVVVIDLKGDRALFETARLEAAAARAEFRWFTTETNHSSHVFNPLQQSHFAEFTPSQKTQLILEALGLDYGDAYGRGFFSAVSEIVLLNFLRHFRVQSFTQLNAIVSDKRAYGVIGNPDDWNNARHLSVLLDRLASVPNLNLTQQDLADRPAARTAAIDMAHLLARPQVVYFNLRSSVAPIVSPAIAKLVMYSLFSAAAQRRPDQNLRVYVVIDEFQQVVSENIPLVLEQARSSGLAFLIAHQSLQQLDKKAVDIRETVSACTAFKQFFRASDVRTIKQLEELSGEATYESLSWTQAIDPVLGVDHDRSFSPLAAEDGRVEVTETIGPRLERNTIIDISATANTSFIQVTEGSEFTQFSAYVTAIITDYHITERQYDNRNKATWPSPTDETVVVERPPDPPFFDTSVLDALALPASDAASSDDSFPDGPQLDASRPAI